MAMYPWAYLFLALCILVPIAMARMVDLITDAFGGSGFFAIVGAAARLQPSFIIEEEAIRARSGIRSSCIVLITTGFEVICTLRGLEDFGAGFEGAHEARDGPFGDFAQKGFELGEGFSMGF